MKLRSILNEVKLISAKDQVFTINNHNIIYNPEYLYAIYDDDVIFMIELDESYLNDDPILDELEELSLEDGIEYLKSQGKESYIILEQCKSLIDFLEKHKIKYNSYYEGDGGTIYCTIIFDKNDIQPYIKKSNEIN